MSAFLVSPVDGTCCDDPCTRSDPCEPCDGCPENICCTDLRGEPVNYTGTYTQNGTWYGTLAYEKNGGGAWFWRDWVAFPEEGWWVVSTVKGAWAPDGVTQQETQPGGDDCPSIDAWWYPLNEGSVVAGACS